MRSSVSSESVTATTERFIIPRVGDGYALECLLSSTARASTSLDLSRADTYRLRLYIM